MIVFILRDFLFDSSLTVSNIKLECTDLIKRQSPEHWVKDYELEMVVISAEVIIFWKYCRPIPKNPFVVTNCGNIASVNVKSKFRQNIVILKFIPSSCQINATTACACQTVNNLAGQENHPHSEKNWHSSNFLFILCQEKALQSTQQN